MSILADRLAAATHDAATLDVETVQASTRQLLLALLELDGHGLDASSVTRLGTRRHVIARLVRHADRGLALLEGRRAPVPDDALLRVAHADLLDRATRSLGAMLAALATIGPEVDRDRAVVVARSHLAWLELSHADFGLERTVDTIPDAALDAVAEHFRTEQHSPFAGLVAH